MDITKENDLLRLIKDQEEESQYLEYKAAKALDKNKKKEIAKDISAMANADGGIIIYGIKEYDQSEKSHLPEKLDPINNIIFPKERLEQIINTNIFPRINNLKITPINLSSDQNDFVYVVEVPKSNTAHQASTMRYHRRYNFEVLEMYDYEIRDIMNRGNYPNIDLEFTLDHCTRIEKDSFSSISPLTFQQFPFSNKSNEHEEKQKVKKKTSATLNIYARNSGNNLAQFINGFIKIPTEILLDNDYDYLKRITIDEREYINFPINNTTRDIVDFTASGIGNSIPKYGPARYDPILPKLSRHVDELRVSPHNWNSKAIIYWDIFADNSSPKEGQTILSEIPISYKEE